MLDGVFDSLRESLRDRARDNICTGLQRLGVHAQMADRGRPEEDTGKGSLGVIDIADGPIPWVNVRKVVYQGGPPSSSGTSTTYYTDYGIKVPYRLPRATIKSVRRKTFPVLGRVVDVDWRARGSDRGSALVADVLRRLREDTWVREAIIATRDVRITGHLGSFWVVSTETRDVPTRQAWDCYQATARHLIEAGPTGAIQWDRIEV